MRQARAESPRHADSSEAKTHSAILMTIIVLIGIGAGLGGMLLAMLLHLIQHLACGYNLSPVVSQESFLNGVTEAPPWQRIAAMTVCRLVAGFDWWAVYAHGRPFVGIKRAVGSDDAPMPLATLGHALLQIVTAGSGPPLGREVAPREVGALFAS